ncbi:Hsp70 family protein [Actinocorallia sp. API 0066]|uniref:Hsp70 family protein n=1 Tax=Actinocorallia sp. API 0066 TaxID=2896846 RepID=UPI001E589C42|nr:Hsp70 family protein [Actinocorallia sp. API 0066]MCD0451274.1 Hsp70 family protein [Actinocorallia sp. API 0066]
MAGWVLAIDFGTSFSTAATLRDGSIDLVEVGNSRYLPSAVALGGDGDLMVGTAALNYRNSSPESAERCPKRALLLGHAVRLGGTDVPVSSLVAAIFRRFAAEATRIHGGPPERLVLTHPARWGDVETAVLKAAAAEADLPEPWLTSEPVAAATYYAARHRVEEGRCVAVYDLGGGTFDTAVLRRAADGFEQVGAAGGHPRLGGEDFDDELLGLVAERAAAASPADWEALHRGPEPAVMRRLNLLRSDVTRLKEELSEHLQREIPVDGFAEAVQVQRAEFVARITPHLRTTMVELAATVERAGLAFADLAEIYLTGGSSRVPLVTDLFAETFGRIPSVEGDPKTVVVIGALHSYRAATSPTSAPASVTAPPADEDEPRITLPRPARRRRRPVARSGIAALLGVAIVLGAAGVHAAMEDDSSSSRTHALDEDDPSDYPDDEPDEPDEPDPPSPSRSPSPSPEDEPSRFDDPSPSPRPTSDRPGGYNFWGADDESDPPAPSVPQVYFRWSGSVVYWKCDFTVRAGAGSVPLSFTIVNNSSYDTYLHEVDTAGVYTGGRAYVGSGRSIYLTDAIWGKAYVLADKNGTCLGKFGLNGAYPSQLVIS